MVSKKQEKQLFEHLANEFSDDGYALFVTTLIVVDVENYASDLKSSTRPLTDWKPIEGALNTLISSYNTTPHRIGPGHFVRRPDMMQMIYWHLDIKKMKDLQTELNPKLRGAPPNKRRAELICQLWRYYPKGKAKKTAESHFEETVKMVLSWLEFCPKDLHKTIITALKGCN